MVLEMSLFENITFTCTLAESKHNTEINVIVNEKYNCEPNNSNVNEKWMWEKRILYSTILNYKLYSTII